MRVSMNMKLPLLLAVVMIGSTSTVLAESGGEHPGRGEFREKMRNHMEQKIKETDTNGDGSISKAEFLAKAEKRFAKMDQNGDGQITPEERKAIRERMEERHAVRRGEGAVR